MLILFLYTPKETKFDPKILFPIRFFLKSLNLALIGRLMPTFTK